MAAGSGLAEPVGVIVVGMLFHGPSFSNYVLQMETILRSICFLSVILQPYLALILSYCSLLVPKQLES